MGREDEYHQTSLKKQGATKSADLGARGRWHGEFLVYLSILRKKGLEPQLGGEQARGKVDILKIGREKGPGGEQICFNGGCIAGKGPWLEAREGVPQC